MPTLNTLRRRDNYETKIAVAEEQSKVLAQQSGIAKDYSEKVKKDYYAWLKENGVDGYRYPLP